MRPDPNDRSSATEPARIIYLGEVRRRRASRRSASDRHYLAVLGLVAIVMWALWVSVILTLQPARLLTYLAFFAPLWMALASTATLLFFAVEWRRGLLPRLGRCGVRGCVAAAIVTVNLAFQAAHIWSFVVLGVTVLGALVSEGVLARRDTQGQ